MINSNALESSNENSLIVQNVIDIRSEHSVAQAQSLRSNSLLATSFFLRKDFYTYSPKSPTRYRRYGPIRTGLTTRTTKNAKTLRHTDANLSGVLFHLLTVLSNVLLHLYCPTRSYRFTCLFPCTVQRNHIVIFLSRILQYDHN